MNQRVSNPGQLLLSELDPVDCSAHPIPYVYLHITYFAFRFQSVIVHMWKDCWLLHHLFCLSLCCSMEIYQLLDKNIFGNGEPLSKLLSKLNPTQPILTFLLFLFVIIKWISKARLLLWQLSKIFSTAVYLCLLINGRWNRLLSKPSMRNCHGWIKDSILIQSWLT